METVSEGEGGIANLKIGGGYYIRYQIPGHDMSVRCTGMLLSMHMYNTNTVTH